MSVRVENPLDVNNDGRVTIADAILVLRVILGETSSTRADVNNDGRVDARDALLILQSLPASKPVVAAKVVSDVSLEGKTFGNSEVALVPVSSNSLDRVEITVRLAGTTQAHGYSLRVLYDSSNLELVEAVVPSGSALAEGPGPQPVALQVSSGHDEVILADVLRPRDSGQKDTYTELLRLTFRVLDKALPGRVEILEALVSDGSGEMYGLTGVRLEDIRPKPLEYALSQNYPNPFNPTTQVAYQMPEAGEVSVVVYNLLGQQVRMLAQGHQQAGYYRVTWDGRDDYGRAVSSGIYLYRFVSKGLVETRRMLLLK